MNNLYIGIDPGVTTGLSFIHHTPFERIVGLDSQKIHRAMDLVKSKCQTTTASDVLIIIEDARERKWFGKNSSAKLQGAGSIKRDCKIWEDFLTDLTKQFNNVQYRFVHPIKNGTKINKSIFEKITGIKNRTNEHSRDAFMLIHRYYKL